MSGFRLGKHRLGDPAHPDVAIVNPTAGQLLKFINNAWRNQFLALDELSDVQIASPADGDVLTYELATALWKNKPPAGGAALDKCRVWKSANQSLASGSTVIPTFDREDFDTNNMHDNTDGYNYYITIKKDGYYLVIAVIEYSPNASGVRISGLYRDGTYIQQNNILYCSASYDAIALMIALWYFPAGYVVRTSAFQNSGSTLNIVGTASYYTSLSVLQMP